MTDLRTIENDSIRAFVQSAADEGYLSGRVLDYGAGKQPWRELVTTAGGTYVPYDRKHFPGNVSGADVGPAIAPTKGPWNSILSTQVLQYLPDEHFRDELDRPRYWESGPATAIQWFYGHLSRAHGHLVLTYPTNWPEVEPEDLHRFTKAGMERLLTEAGFEVVRHEQRGRDIFFAVPGGHYLNHGRGEIALGYGVIARA